MSVEDSFKPITGALYKAKSRIPIFLQKNNINRTKFLYPNSVVMYIKEYSYTGFGAGKTMFYFLYKGHIVYDSIYGSNPYKTFGCYYEKL